LPEPRGHHPENPVLRRAGLLVVHEAAVAGPLHLVAHHAGRWDAPVGARVGHRAVEWQSAAGWDGGRLEEAGLRRAQVGLIIPREPRLRRPKDRGAMLL